MDTPSEANGSEAWVDGNAAAGVLASVFAMDATRARIVCAGCGQSTAVGELRAFGLEMGAVLRCPTCAGVTLRIAATKHGWFLDLRGAEVMHFV